MHCRQSLRFVSPAHRRFPYASTAATASMHGFALHGSVQSVGQCFADVQSVCAEAHMNHVVTARCRIVLASSQCRRRAASHVCVPAPRRRKPHASLLHNAAFCKVSASHYAKASFCVCHRLAPFGFAKQALCKVACASGASSLPATGYGRGVPRPPRPRLPGFPRGVPAFFLSQCASRKGR